jgi:hypothetical protein
MTRTKPRVEQAAGLSSWVVGLRAQWVRYNTESVFAAPRPVKGSVLSNRIGLESQEVEIERRVESHRVPVGWCLEAERSLEAFTKGFGYTCVCDGGGRS